MSSFLPQFQSASSSFISSSAKTQKLNTNKLTQEVLTMASTLTDQMFQYSQLISTYSHSPSEVSMSSSSTWRDFSSSLLHFKLKFRVRNPIDFDTWGGPEFELWGTHDMELFAFMESEFGLKLDPGPQTQARGHL